MDIPKDPNYPDLPGLIFGCSPSKHSKAFMKIPLGRFHVQVKSSDKKKDTLLKLIELERSIGEREKEALVKWFAGERSFRALAALLNDAWKPEIAPRRVDGPAAKKVKLEETNDDIIFAAVDKCTVCLEKLAPEKFPQTRITSTCAHDPTICSHCVTDHLNYHIQTKALDQISCPGCPEKFSDAEIEQYASPEILKRVRRKEFIMSLQSHSNFTWCVGNPSCDSGQIHTEPDQPMMTCSTCGFKTCAAHKLPWHNDLTCAEFDISNQDRVRDEASSAAFIAENAKVCPNPNCHMRIELEHGCDRVRCDYCNFTFCYSCYADWSIIRKRGNDHHGEDCRWHTKNENGIPRHGRRRGPAAEKSKEAKKPKKSKQAENFKKTDVGPAPKEPDILQEPKESKDVDLPMSSGATRNPAISEDVKHSHPPIVSSEAADGMSATANGMQSFQLRASNDVKHLLEPNIKEELKGRNQPQEPVRSLKQTDLTKALGMSLSNSLKRPREE
ncbi:uncharacterized protein EAF01_003933 [Botrytis porri]|uniref:uncharacterized protein n=1 Tax=Botrytis porri TaxID=87229 RepID=UPI0019000FFB|nr:uncharacterized protein EAF01_003933 [Botrytis porri]KAF7908178.1 hypothetical protein EAF01_003933 [Botrytis porri]